VAYAHDPDFAALSDAAAQIKTKARMQDDAHLALRSLDIDIRKAEADRLIQEEDEERALAYVAQAKAITDMLLQGTVPPRSSSHALLRLTGDLSAETVIETWKSELGVGIYDAGIPLATLWKRSFAFTEEVAESLQEALEWWEKEELRITERTLGGHVIHLGSDDHRAVGMLTRGKELYRVRAVSEEAAVALLDKAVSLDPVTARDVASIRNSRQWHRTVDLEKAAGILAFDYESAVCVVPADPSPSEREAANRLKDAFGCELVSPADAGPYKVRIVLGTPDSNEMIRQAFANGVLSLRHEDQGLLSYASDAEAETVFVAGKAANFVSHASRTLENLASVMKDRQILIGDLHMHSLHSDGISEPFVVALATMRNYMDFAALTDHNTTSGALDAREKFKEAGIDHTLIIGQEMSATWAHFIVLGTEEIIPWEAPPEEVLKAAHDENAVVIVAHPGLPAEEPEWPEVALRTGLSAGVHGFEASARAPEFYPAWKKMERLPSMVASTDSHTTAFTYWGEAHYAPPPRTVVFAEENTPDAVVEAIRNGYCIGYAGGTLYGPDFLVDVFQALFEEGKYLQNAHSDRLKQRVRSLHRRLHIDKTCP